MSFLTFAGATFMCSILLIIQNSYHSAVTKLLSSMPSIRTYVRKDMMTAEFIKAIQALPTMPNVHLYNGKTFWTDKNLRLDYGDNRPGSNEIHFNLQKNKESKLDGLKKVQTHDKILSLKVYKDVAVDPTEVVGGIVDQF